MTTELLNADISSLGTVMDAIESPDNVGDSLQTLMRHNLAELSLRIVETSPV